MGLERTPKLSEKQGVSARGGAESGAGGAWKASIDPDLGELIAAWPALPEEVKAGILAIVQTGR
jgi:hypothetical protein